MISRLTVSLNYGTHLPALMRALEIATPGPVLELGMGIFSSPYLHYACKIAGRKLWSYDNNLDWVNFFRLGGYQTYGHQLQMVADWDKAAIERPWAVALIDHSPGSRRADDIRRLAPYAKCLVIHDTNGRYDKEYKYSTIYPLFKYRLDFIDEHRHAAILSNHYDLDRLMGKQ